MKCKYEIQFNKGNKLAKLIKREFYNTIYMYTLNLYELKDVGVNNLRYYFMLRHLDISW
jgi:hypothetical protein